MERHEAKINITKCTMCSDLFVHSSNHVQIAGVFYEEARHARAEAKSLFHKAGCGTAEIHYGLREEQHRDDHSKLEWDEGVGGRGGGVKTMQVVVPMSKGRG